jgi:hypothetical protein
MQVLSITEERTESTATPAPVRQASLLILASKKMPWYLEMLCRIRCHRGQWSYLAEGDCKQMRVCQRCGKADMRIRHQRQWHYVREGDCFQDKTCLRCAETNNHRTRHVWGTTYSTGWSQEAHQCERCGKVEEWTVTG